MKIIHVKRVFCAAAPNGKHGSARLGRKALNHAFNFGETEGKRPFIGCVKSNYSELG